MNYVRIIGCALVSLFGLFLTYRQVSTAFSDGNIIKVDGLLNMWGSYGMLLVFFYLMLYHIKHSLAPSLAIGKPETAILVIAIVVSPLFAMGTYSQAQANVANYVECKSERKLSSRYSSRTYAITEDLCQTLKSQND